MAKFDVDEGLVRKLSELLDDTGLTEIEYRAGEQTIRVSRGGAGAIRTSTTRVISPISNPGFVTTSKPKNAPS